MESRLIGEVQRLDECIAKQTAMKEAKYEKHHPDWKQAQDQEWEQRLKVFAIQRKLCNAMEATCERYLIDLEYPCDAVREPTNQLMNFTEQLGR